MIGRLLAAVTVLAVLMAGLMTFVVLYQKRQSVRSE